MLGEIGVRVSPEGRKGGLAAWLFERLRGKVQQERHLTLVERIALAPKQSLALVDAEGHRLLVAFSADGTPVFHALNDSTAQPSRRSGVVSESPAARTQRRISW